MISDFEISHPWSYGTGNDIRKLFKEIKNKLYPEYWRYCNRGQLQVIRASISRAVRSLVQRGYLSQTKKSEVRSWIYLTDEGRRIINLTPVGERMRNSSLTLELRTTESNNTRKTIRK